MKAPRVPGKEWGNVWSSCSCSGSSSNKVQQLQSLGSFWTSLPVMVSECQLFQDISLSQKQGIFKAKAVVLGVLGFWSSGEKSLQGENMKTAIGRRVWVRRQQSRAEQNTAPWCSVCLNLVWGKEIGFPGKTFCLEGFPAELLWTTVPQICCMWGSRCGCQLVL